MGRHETPPFGTPADPSRPDPWQRPSRPSPPSGSTPPHGYGPPAPEDEPGAVVPASDAPPPAWQDTSGAPRKAGRNLPMAIGVGVGLGAVVLASLLIYRPVFIAVIAVAVAVGVWELSSAMRTRQIGVPVIPLVACGWGMLALTWFGGATLLAVGIGVTIAVLLVWRLADGATGYHTDVPASVLVATYVPFLGGFAVLLLAGDDGHLRVLATLIVAVLSDTGGYVAGVLAGRHPMAPKISPKKSWEGMAGSLLACAVGGVVVLHFMFGVVWWQGALYGMTLAVAATVGDLTESLIKRDLGVKDMSRLVPGHGGLMDRLDSILMVLPVSFVWLSLVVPAGA